MPISKINSVAISSLSHFVGKAKGDYGKILGNTFAAGQGVSIITTNLVQHLNAGDSNSYPGSGTTWTDLVSNVDGTFVSQSRSNRGGIIIVKTYGIVYAIKKE